MLHIAKIFCLILVATATSIFAEEAVMSAVEKFNAALRLSRQHVNSKDYLMMQGLMKLNETTLVRLDQAVQQRLGSHRELLAARIVYGKWDEKTRQLLSEAKTKPVRSFAKSEEEVKTYVSMYADHRISGVQAAMFINENEHQLRAIVDSAMFTYATVVQEVKILIRGWTIVELPGVRHFEK